MKVEGKLERSRKRKELQKACKRKEHGDEAAGDEDENMRGFMDVS